LRSCRNLGSDYAVALRPTRRFQSPNRAIGFVQRHKLFDQNRGAPIPAAMKTAASSSRADSGTRSTGPKRSSASRPQQSCQYKDRHRLPCEKGCTGGNVADHVGIDASVLPTAADSDGREIADSPADNSPGAARQVLEG